MIHFLFPNAFFNPEILSWESSVSMKQNVSSIVYSMTKTMKHPTYGEHRSQYAPLFLQCNIFNIYNKMGNSNGHGPFLWPDGRSQTTPGQCMRRCQCLRLTHLSTLRRLLHSGYAAQTFLLPKAQLQSAPAQREQVMVCSRWSLRLVSLPLFTFLIIPKVITKHHLSWTFQSHEVISCEQQNIFFLNKGILFTLF